MDKQSFDESWPANNEGHDFSDKFKLDQQRVDKKSWGGRFASLFVGAVGIVALIMPPVTATVVVSRLWGSSASGTWPT